MPNPDGSFRRGNGPLVSVLMASRGRSDHLRAALDSLLSLADDQRNVEFVLKVDDDDDETVDTCEKLYKFLPPGMFHYIRSPRGRGYLDIHLWLDQQARAARGDWLFVFNDDARMLTQGWDSALVAADANGLWHGCDDVCMLVAPTRTRPFAQEFFLVRRAMLDILGRLSPSPHADNWLWAVMSLIRSAYYTRTLVDHFSEHMDDDTRRESVVAYGSTGEELNSMRLIREQVADAVKLLDYVEREGAKRG